MITKQEIAQLDPSPIGWFAIGLSKELQQGQEETGVLCAAPYRVRRNLNGELESEGSALCVMEQNGFILAWHHPKGEQPEWSVPELDMSGWRPLIHKKLKARSHPQETFENSIDMAHFPIVHGFSDIKVLQEPTFEEHSMSVRYEISRSHPIPMFSNITPNFEVKVHGIGCAHNHIHVPDFGMRVRMFAWSTPTKPGFVDIRLGVSIAKDLKLPLSGLLAPLIHRGISKNVVDDFSQDIEIWENKRYKAPPVLVRNDGPIGLFRQYCRKYYIDDSVDVSVRKKSNAA